MLDPEWPAPLPKATAYGSRAAKRLAYAAALRDRLAVPARRIALERWYLRFRGRIIEGVREGLSALGFDPTQSPRLDDVEAKTVAELAALPPENGAPELPTPSPEALLGDDFLRLVARYRKPDTEPPNIAKESIETLWAFVYARSPRHGLMPFGEEYVARYDAAPAEQAGAVTPLQPDSAESARYY